MRISDWSLDVCSSDLRVSRKHLQRGRGLVGRRWLSLSDPRRHGDGAHLLVARGGLHAQLQGVAELVPAGDRRSEDHTSELQSLMRISYAVFCLKKKNKYLNINNTDT